MSTLAFHFAALRAKLAQRGPLGFATDALELSAACYLIAAWQVIAGGAALAGVFVSAPLVAWELLTRGGRS